MTLETRAAFARRLGVHKSNVTRAAQAGRIVLVGDLVDVEKSLERWHATQGGRTDVAARHAAQRGGEIPMAQAATENATVAQRGATVAQPAPQPAIDMPEDVASDGRAKYKAMALKYENDAIKLEMALRHGKRYPLEAVKREAHSLGATLRAAIERVIDQTAPRLAVMKSEADRMALLQAECAKLARFIKGEFPRSLRRMRQEGGKA